MGVDFLKRAAPTFRKSWNNGRTDLATPDLFTREQGACTRALTADTLPSSNVTSGSTVTLVTQERALIILDGSRPVGRIDRPPGDTFARIADAGGVAIAKVCSVYPLSETFDVELP